MKAKCKNCEFTSEHEQVHNHTKKTHQDKDPTSFILTDDVEVVEFYRKGIAKILFKKLKDQDTDFLLEEVECDLKEFQHIHPDYTENALNKYGKKKLISEVIQSLLNSESGGMK